MAPSDFHQSRFELRGISKQTTENKACNADVTQADLLTGYMICKVHTSCKLTTSTYIWTSVSRAATELQHREACSLPVATIHGWRTGCPSCVESRVDPVKWGRTGRLGTCAASSSRTSPPCSARTAHRGCSSAQVLPPSAAGRPPGGTPSRRGPPVCRLQMQKAFRVCYCEHH